MAHTVEVETGARLPSAYSSACAANGKTSYECIPQTSSILQETLEERSTFYTATCAANEVMRWTIESIATLRRGRSTLMRNATMAL